MDSSDQKEDWLDVEPLQIIKKTRGAHLINPKVYGGVNTIGSTLGVRMYDIRGDLPIPKINVSPWMNSTIEPDANIKNICKPAFAKTI
jgi:hypothetical protein